MSTRRRATQCLQFAGAVASTPSCVCASREPENMAARRLKMRWRSCAAWLMHRNRTDCALNGIGIKLDATIAQELREAIPSRQRIANRISEPAAPRRAAELLLEPDLQLFDQRLRERPSLGQPQRRRLTADAFLDGIELANPSQRFGRDGRVGCFEEFIEVAPYMHPTGGQRDIAARPQSRKAGVAVNVEIAREVLQVRRRPLALAIGRVHEDGCRCRRAAPRSLVTRVHPKPPVLVRPRPGSSTGTGVSSANR